MASKECVVDLYKINILIDCKVLLVRVVMGPQLITLTVSKDMACEL